MVRQRCEALDHRARQCGKPGARLVRNQGWLCKDHDPDRLNPPLGQLCAAEGCGAPAENYDDSFGLWYCPQHTVEQWRGPCTALVQTLYPCAREAEDLYHFEDDCGHDPHMWLCERHHWQYTQPGGPKRELVLLDWQSLGYPEMQDSSDGKEPLEDPDGIDGVIDWERRESDDDLIRFVLSHDTGRMWEIRYAPSGRATGARIVTEGSDTWTPVDWQSFGIDAIEADEDAEGLRGYVSFERLDGDGGVVLHIYSQRSNRLWQLHLNSDGVVDSVLRAPDDLAAEDIC
ncbi:MAG TPA: hypothetical protein VHS06_01065 [Chloroflexota bacterium]|nr:hypothetical protein [Chloroflexota bacterium]